MSLILGSQSPRRKELLEGLNIPFKVITPNNVEEIYPKDMPAHQVPVFLAKLKAEALKNECDSKDIILTSDTIVCFDNRIFEKPKSSEEACTMLSELSNNTHEVITGVAITYGDKQTTFSDVTRVHFGNLAEQEIKHYVDNYKPFDKAGSYGVQEWIGYIGVTGIEGSYYNVMGLPVTKVYAELKKIMPGI